MSSESKTLFGGGFEPTQPVRVNSLNQARGMVRRGKPFAIRPRGANTSIFEGLKTQTQYTKGTSWTQLVAQPETGESTKYSKIFPKLNVTDLTRANKALVAGKSRSQDPQQGVNNWKAKTYSDSGLLGTSLIRINETVTAFGQESMGSGTRDAGTGIMAEILQRKWHARNQGQTLSNMSGLRKDLEGQFPQLISVEKMRQQGSEGLESQIDISRTMAAIRAGQRGLRKGINSRNIDQYVNKKFSKHGLGNVPRGWKEFL